MILFLKSVENVVTPAIIPPRRYLRTRRVIIETNTKRANTCLRAFVLFTGILSIHRIFRIFCVSLSLSLKRLLYQLKFKGTYFSCGSNR